jgi:hypothetical protein
MPEVSYFEKAMQVVPADLATPAEAQAQLNVKIVREAEPPERFVSRQSFYLKRNTTCGDIAPSLNRTNMLRQV